MAGVVCHHWLPAAWRGPVTTEIGVFFFLTLTGFLITRVLLRERSAAEHVGGKWRARAYLHFLKRRMSRILLPCYAAMIFAIVAGAPDIREHAWAYFGHWSNFHMAEMRGWPSGTAHYWTLAIQVQFYLVWPVLLFLVPRRWIGVAFLAVAAVAPLSRFVLAHEFPEICHAEAITGSALDYFGIGAWLALALDRGLALRDLRLRAAAWAAFSGYAVLYALNEAGHPLPGLRYFQQTLVAVAFAGLISATLAGFGGVRGKLLDHPVVQHVGRLSFGLYLFHTPVPLLLGKIVPQLWENFSPVTGLLLRLPVFAAVSWALAYLCWRFLENARGPFSSRGVANPRGR